MQALIEAELSNADEEVRAVLSLDGGVARRVAAKLYIELRSHETFDRLTYWDNVPEKLEAAYGCAALVAHAAGEPVGSRALDVAAVIARRRTELANAVHVALGSTMAAWSCDETVEAAQTPAFVSVAKDWPAWTTWTSIEAALGRYRHRVVPVEAAGQQRLVTLGDLIAEPDAFYLAQHRLFDQIPDLRADVGLVRVRSARTEPVAVAWVGRGASTPVHADPLSNVVVQILGSKRWWLWPPENNEQPRIVDVHPGQALFVPALWWHAVACLGSETTLTVSFWS